MFNRSIQQVPPLAFLAVAAAMGVASIALGYLANVRSEPVRFGLVALQASHDFGELSQGESVSATFELVNQGPTVVTVVDIIESCACSEASLSKEVIGPGQSTTLTTKYRTGTSRGEQATDLFIKYHTPEVPGPKYTRLQLLANVIADFHMEPIALEFSAAGDVEQVLRIWPERVNEVDVRRAYTTHRAFSSVLEEDDKKDEDVQKIRVTFDPTRWGGKASLAHLILETSSTNEPRCKIPLLVRAAPEGDVPN